MKSVIVSQMQEYYRRRAPIYDQSMNYDQPEVVARQKPVINLLCSWMAGRDVLEIACGPAFWTGWIAQNAKSIVATDYNESTLVEARKKEIPGQVTFRQADAYALPDFDVLFDVVYAVDWFCHVPIKSRGAFLEGLHGMLRSNASVVFCDQLPRTEEGFSSKKEDYFQTRSLPDGPEYQVIKNYPDEGDVREIFAPYSRDIEYRAFPEARRWMVRYFLG